MLIKQEISFITFPENPSDVHDGAMDHVGQLSADCWPFVGRLLAVGCFHLPMLHLTWSSLTYKNRSVEHRYLSTVG